ncbi:hypothetical protein [Streptomyces sp. NPDC050121]|uniref:hypothetical protein n=1 Tax=Streptomyces sp. NPDC050121 TaxID=3365601 RepID=UPI0037BDB06C
MSSSTTSSRRRESFYWAAVLATFALGTAAGDLTATIGLGYLGRTVGGGPGADAGEGPGP